MKKRTIPENCISLASVEEMQGEEVELVSDVEILSEQSEEDKKRAELALCAAREQIMAKIDQQKLPLALQEIGQVSMLSEIMDDPEVLDRVKSKVNTPMDLKFLAEAQKIKLQNLQTLLRMDSVDTDGNAGETFVAVEFGSTKVVVGKK